MNNDLFGYFFGVMTGIALVAALQHFNPDSYINIASKAITECEKSLPRDEKCIIIAIPLSKD